MSPPLDGRGGAATKAEDKPDINTPVTATQLDPDLFGPDSPCFGCAPTHPIGFRLTFERDGDLVRTRFSPSDRYQGPPGIMHGGLVMTLADEIAAWTVITLKERFGFTTSVEGRLSRAVRIGVETEGRGRIVSASTRIVKVAVEIEQQASQCFRGEFSFILLDRASAEKLLGGPLPAAWERFSR
jgi:acyl-coenzyme A thioesterase PaaI-like protein